MPRCFECRKIVDANELINIYNVKVCSNCKPIVLQKVEEFGDVVEPLKPVGLSIRLVSLFIDCLILIFINILSFWVVILFLDSFRNNRLIEVFTLCIWSMNIFTYFVYFVGKSGATPGKKIMGIQIIRIDEKPLNYGIAVLRYFASLISLLIFGIGLIMIIFDKKFSRSFHDRICTTRVVMVNKKVSPRYRIKN